MLILANEIALSWRTALMDVRNLNGERDDLDATNMARPDDPRSELLCDSLQRIRTLIKCGASGVESSGVASLVAVEGLLFVMDDDDALTAFMAMQSLREQLLQVHESEVAHQYIKFLVTQRLDHAKASRFQLLRQLIKPPKDLPTPEENRRSDDEDSGEQECLGASPHVWYWDGLLANLHSFNALIKCTIEQTSASFSRTHEALGCLANIVKRACSDKSELPASSQAELIVLIKWVVTQASQWNFSRDGGSMPTFIACGLIDLVMNTKALCEEMEAAWLPLALQLVKPSGPISVLALGLLRDDSMVADASCADSFTSPSSSYPLLQKWIHLCCIAASEALTTGQATVLKACEDWTPWTLLVTSLPPRSRLLAVLTEQDDTLIDVLLQLLHISSDVKGLEVLVPTEVMRFRDEQLDPHLLFADLLSIFGDDHLVILDMLMSSETRMLEYASHYLRDAAASWSHTKLKWHSVSRTNAVMAVLIRLRLETERLMDAGVFPYNPRPLLCRLQTLEDLFEHH